MSCNQSTTSSPLQLPGASKARRVGDRLGLRLTALWVQLPPSEGGRFVGRCAEDEDERPVGGCVLRPRGRLVVEWDGGDGGVRVRVKRAWQDTMRFEWRCHLFRLSSYVNLASTSDPSTHCSCSFQDAPFCTPPCPLHPVLPPPKESSWDLDPRQSSNSAGALGRLRDGGGGVRARGALAERRLSVLRMVGAPAVVLLGWAPPAAPAALAHLASVCIAVRERVS